MKVKPWRPRLYIPTCDYCDAKMFFVGLTPSRNWHKGIPVSVGRENTILSRWICHNHSDIVVYRRCNPGYYAVQMLDEEYPIWSDWEVKKHNGDISSFKKKSKWFTVVRFIRLEDAEFYIRSHIRCIKGKNRLIYQFRIKDLVRNKLLKNPSLAPFTPDLVSLN